MPKVVLPTVGGEIGGDTEANKDANDDKYNKSNVTGSGGRSTLLTCLLVCAGWCVTSFVVERRVNARIDSLQKNNCQSLVLLATEFSSTPLQKNAAYAKCQHVFIDGGMNRGDNIDAFANAGKSEEISKMKSAYFNAIGKGIDDVCVFGFEGNSKFDKVLKDKEALYANKFRHIELRTRTVLANETKDMLLYMDESEDAVSSSIMADSGIARTGKRQQSVKAIDLAAFISQFELDSLFVKLDVEGAEYGIMKSLLRQ